MIRPILWNKMTSPETVLNGVSVKTKLCNTPPLYFIVLTSSVKILEVKAIEFHKSVVYLNLFVYNLKHIAILYILIQDEDLLSLFT